MSPAYYINLYRRAAARNLVRRAPQGPRRSLWAMEGLGRLRDCCGYGSMGCCDIIAELQRNGYDENGNFNGRMAGLGDEISDLLTQVTDTLRMIPGASSVTPTAAQVKTVYEVASGETAEKLDQKYADYKRKVAYLNEVLPKIDATEDASRRLQLLRDYQSTANAMAKYGESLINQINAYNKLAAKIADLSEGKVRPEQVSVAGLAKLSVPNLSGLGFAVGIPLVVLVGIIALVVYKSLDLVSDYMHYDLVATGHENGMNREYEGLMGGLQKGLEKIGGSVMTVALLAGAGFIGYLFLKNYLSKREAKAPPVPAPSQVVASVAEGI